MVWNRILVTHVGSLVRLPRLVESLKKIDANEAYDVAAYQACLSASIAEVVQQQADAGVDIVSDGEFAKGISWAFYVHERLDGIMVKPLTPEEAKDPDVSPLGGRDRLAFPEFYAESDPPAFLKRMNIKVVCDGPIKYCGQA